uniref:Uncharacterized protein n=1 Tax=Anguilla anguilla TaxID=7936 RepID=A0A0E9UN18_ANGAN
MFFSERLIKSVVSTQSTGRSIGSATNVPF